MRHQARMAWLWTSDGKCLRKRLPVCLMGMKAMFLVAILATTTIACADMSSPFGHVQNVISHAQKGRLVGLNLELLATDPEQPRKKEEVLRLLKRLDPEQLVFEARDKEAGIHWFPVADLPGVALVRLLKPVALDFEIRLIQNKAIGCKGYYEVVAIHVRP